MRKRKEGKYMKYMIILDEMSQKYSIDLTSKDIKQIKDILSDSDYREFINQFTIDMDAVMNQGESEQQRMNNMTLIEFEYQLNELIETSSIDKRKELAKHLLFYALSIAVEEYDKDRLDFLITCSLNDVLDLKMSEFRMLNNNDSLH